MYVDDFRGVEHVFGWHMWTQALIDGQWIDLDATLPVPYHAAHVLVSTTAMADEGGNRDLASLMRMVGNVDVEVLDLQHEQRRRTTRQGARRPMR